MSIEWVCLVAVLVVPGAILAGFLLNLRHEAKESERHRLHVLEAEKIRVDAKLAEKVDVLAATVKQLDARTSSLSLARAAGR